MSAYWREVARVVGAGMVMCAAAALVVITAYGALV